MSRALQFIRGHQRWVIVALLFVMAMINNLDRQALSVLAPTLRDRLGFGPVEYSYIVSAFLAAYTIGYAFCGRVLDRLGVKIGLGLALAFWSLAGIAHALAAGWVGLLICRFFLGLGESFNSPGGLKAIAEWVPVRERALSTAIFSNGNIMGAILAPPLVSFLALQFDWHWGFIVTGLMGFVLLAVWWRFYDSPEKHRGITVEERALVMAARATPGAAAAKQVAMTMGQMLRHPLCVGFFLVRFLTDSTTYFFSFWLPDYLQHGRGFTLAMIGFVGWLPFLAADVGGPGGGALSDWLVRRGWAPAAARKRMMLIAACLMPLALVAVRIESGWIALGLIAVLLAAQSCWMANQLTLIAESVSRESVATLIALSAMGGSVGGILSNLLAGRAIGAYGYVPVFTVIGCLHLTAFGVLLLAWRRAERAAR